MLWLAVVTALATWLAATRWDDMSAPIDDLSPGPLIMLVAASGLLLVAGFRAVLLARDLLLTTVAEIVARRGRAGT